MSNPEDDRHGAVAGPVERPVRPLPEPDYPAGSRGMLGEDCYAAETVQRLLAAERERFAKKPLTAQQLDRLIEAHVGGAELADGEYSAMVMFAAAVERAHGIGA